MGLALAAAATPSRLAAQAIARDSAVSIRVTTRVTSSAPLSPSLAREVYVAAFRSSARQWCAAGSATGLDDALAGTRSIVQKSVAEADRAGVDSALVGAHAELSGAGGCGGLGRPTRLVVVDRFEGHPWNAPRQKIAPRDEGARSEDGYTLVTRRTKIGADRSRRVSAEADFTFTSEREELVRGRYRVQVRADKVAERWNDVETSIAEQYPTLRVVRAGNRPDSANDSGEPAAADVRHWVTSFVNPDTQALEIRIFVRPLGDAQAASPRDWVIVVDYLGFAGR